MTTPWPLFTVDHRRLPRRIARPFRMLTPFGWSLLGSLALAVFIAALALGVRA